MTDLTPLGSNRSSSVADEGSDSILEATGDFVADIISGVPSPIRKNAFKVFAQLCSAAIDVPVAHFEGIAAEKRAESKARAMLIGVSAKQIAEQMNVDEGFVVAASNRFARKVVQEELNLQRIAKVALEELKKEEVKAISGTIVEDVEMISDDWLHAFEREASTKNSEDMQLLFGKILAGKIRKPSSFSIKTVRLVSQLDESVAKIFVSFCSLAISLELDGSVVDARVIVLGSDDSPDPLRDYGMNFGSLLLLQENGLLMAQMKTGMDYGVGEENNNPFYRFTYLKQNWYLETVDGDPFAGEVMIVAPTMSSAGKELLSIVDVSINESYSVGLQEYFGRSGLKMVCR